LAKITKPLLLRFGRQTQRVTLNASIRTAEKHAGELLPGEPWTQAEKEFADEVIQRFFDEDR
jgi:hypothetical protein